MLIVNVEPEYQYISVSKPLYKFFFFYVDLPYLSFSHSFLLSNASHCMFSEHLVIVVAAAIPCLTKFRMGHGFSMCF